jgi:hypothetical protein
MTKKKNVSTAAVTARLAAPPKNDGESLVTTTNQQLNAVMACPDYPNQPTVQNIAKSLQTNTNDLDTTLRGPREGARRGAPARGQAQRAHGHGASRAA